MTEKDYSEFVLGLNKDEKMLIALRDELYVGSWERMKKDLKNRLEDRPYIPKIASRIEEDLPRIEKLQSLELKHKINLADILRDYIPVKTN